jgi:hypothetical protein
VTFNRLPKFHRACALAAAAIAAGVLAAPGAASAEETTSPTLAEALAALPVTEEVRDGYDRKLFKHWVDEDKDGCNTRQEVLIAEAVMSPAVDSSCKTTGGRWYSYYDDVYIDGASGLDIDHLVPLAESWDSGARDWDSAKRQAYANDLGENVPLIAVTAKSNRSKSDQDPAEWMPTDADASCRYAYEWVSVKTRWALSIDEAEADALEAIVADCPVAVVTIAPA